MARHDGNQLQQQIEAAFASFRESIAEALTSAAQDSVDQTIKELTASSGPFSVDAAEVEVVVHNIHFSSASGAAKAGARSKRPAASRPSRGRKRAPRRKADSGNGRRGRPDGPVKTALLQTFTERPGVALKTEELRTALNERGVQASNDNLHQQLRRLVAAGTVERAGRGLYQAKPDAAPSDS